MRPAFAILMTAVWNILGVLVLTTGLLRAQESQASGLWEALENAKDAAGLAAVAPRIDAFLKANPCKPRLPMISPPYPEEPKAAEVESQIGLHPRILGEKPSRRAGAPHGIDRNACGEASRWCSGSVFGDFSPNTALLARESVGFLAPLCSDPNDRH